MEHPPLGGSGATPSRGPPSEKGRQAMAKRASKRTWALGTLDRSVVWIMWFDVGTNRWEVVPRETVDL